MPSHTEMYGSAFVIKKLSFSLSFKPLKSTYLFFNLGIKIVSHFTIFYTIQKKMNLVFCYVARGRKTITDRVFRNDIAAICHDMNTLGSLMRPEKCLGGAAGYPWQWPLSHTDFDPTISGRDTTKLWSFPLGFFQGQLGTVSWCVLGKRLWGHTRGSRSLALLCQAHNQGRKWLHPKGNHHPQEIKPLVWWRMLGSPEG